jgi:hypothetical protein
MIMKKITALSLALALSACQYLMATLRSERKMLKRDEEGERPGAAGAGAGIAEAAGMSNAQTRFVRGNTRPKL